MTSHFGSCSGSRISLWFLTDVRAHGPRPRWAAVCSFSSDLRGRPRRPGCPLPGRRAPQLRARVEDVVWNQREPCILGSHPGCQKAHEVSLGCTDDIFVGQGEAINFFSSGSSVTFPPWGVQGGGLLLWLWGRAEQACSSPIRQRRGPAALGILRGLLRARVGSRDRSPQVSSSSLVSDNRWHGVPLRFRGRDLDLTVDGQG